MITEIPLICQECLLCLHGKPYLTLNKQDNCNQGYPATAEEWQLISDVYTELTSYDQPIEINLLENGKLF